MKNGMKKTGRAIKFYREKLGLSRMDLSKLLNVTASLIAKWENGERSPRVNIDKLCKFLCVTKEEIFYFEDESDKNSPDKLYYEKYKKSFLFSLIAVTLMVFSFAMIYTVRMLSISGDALNNFSRRGKDVDQFHLIVRSIDAFCISAFIVGIVLLITVIILSVRAAKKRKREAWDDAITITRRRRR